MTGYRRRSQALTELSTALCGIPPATPEAWESVLQLARELHVAPPLWRALSGAALRPEQREVLRREHVVNTLRNVMLRRQLLEAIEALNEREIVPLLFKGALALLDGSLVGLGDRWMVDLDVLVGPDGSDRAVQALLAVGYRVDAGKPFLHPHELVLAHPGRQAVIELHVQLGSPPLPAILPAAEAWAAARPVALESGGALALNPTHQVLHNILHASLQDLGHRVGGLSLRQLIVLSRLVSFHGAEVDWRFVQDRMAAVGQEHCLRDHLWLAHRLAGLELPAFVSGSPRRRLHEARVRIGFAVGWLPEVHRNLTHAFGRDYLDSIYHHGDVPVALAVARARHAVSVLRRDGRAVIEQALRPKV